MDKRFGEHEADVADFLPIYEIRPNCMYVSYILRFAMASRPEIHSSYQQLRPNFDIFEIHQVLLQE
jgi:hypothetical protein